MTRTGGCVLVAGCGIWVEGLCERMPGVLGCVRIWVMSAGCADKCMIACHGYCPAVAPCAWAS